MKFLFPILVVALLVIPTWEAAEGQNQGPDSMLWMRRRQVKQIGKILLVRGANIESKKQCWSHTSNLCFCKRAFSNSQIALDRGADVNV